MISFRILIASIRDKGQCPCPRCLTPFAEVEKIGTPEDMERRLRLTRLADDTYREKVKRARNLIYKKNHAVSSDEVEKLLQSTSLTPTNVRQFLIPPPPHARISNITHAYSTLIPERLFKKTRPVQLQYIPGPPGGSHARIRAWCMESPFHPSTQDS